MNRPQGPDPIPIIHDCDPGHDDAVALLLAVQSPRIDLRAVTTTFGNCSLDDATRNAMRVLTLAGATATPLARGAKGPLVGAAELGNYVHGQSGLDGPALPDPRMELSPLPATELMAEVLLSSEGPVTIVATGPITNVARLLRDHGHLSSRIGHIIFMGGSTERGNHTPTAEFNAYCDPEALAIVLGSGLPVSMVGLNLTHQALANREVLDRMHAMDHEVGRIAAGWMGFFSSSYRAIWDFQAPPVHDPCTVAALISPELLTWRDCFVAVETAGNWTRGTTVVDLHDRYGRPANARVAITLDVEGYWDLVLSAIDALGRSA